MFCTFMYKYVVFTCSWCNF